MSEPPEPEPKPTVDDALLDPDLVSFPRIGYGKYPYHAVLRPQWLKSHSHYPFWLHFVGDWHWMTSRLRYALEPIASPEEQLLDEIDPSEHPEYTGDAEAWAEADKKYWDNPEKVIVRNPPGEIEVIAHTVPEKTRLGIFPTVKEAMVTFEKFWLENRSRILETEHHYREVVIEAPDWRYHLHRGQNLDRPPEHPMIDQIQTYMLNFHRVPVIRTQLGSYRVYKPEAVSFYENEQYPGNTFCSSATRMANI